jgi:hypothetical protein
MTWAAATVARIGHLLRAKDPDGLEAVEGTITDAGGRPVGEARFHRSDDTYGDDPGPVFTSEPDGSYCVLWPTGSTRPFAQPLDPRLRSSTVEPAPTSLPEANDCQTTEQRTPWYRYQSLTWTWRYSLLLGLPALFAAAGLLGHTDGRARRLRLVGGALIATNAVLFVVLWNVFQPRTRKGDTREKLSGPDRAQGWLRRAPAL